jgi:hypothetical protein
MATSANVYVHEGTEQGVYLYQHWDGDQLPETVAASLRRGKERWSDATYLRRIIFSEMIRDHLLDLTGYGISAFAENDNGLIVDVDTKAATVSLVGFSDKPETYSFAKFSATE